LRDSILSSINFGVNVEIGENRFDFSSFSETVVVTMTFEAGFRTGRRAERNASEEAWGGG
jgi:hypothetical protein